MSSVSIAVLIMLFVAQPARAGNIILPPAGAQYDSQLGGAYDPPQGTEIVSRDWEAPAMLDAYSICYINAFQTQAAEQHWWQATHADLLLRTADGELVEDPNWPGEIVLDTRTDAKRAALFDVVSEWIDACADGGFDAIEADNLDTYSRSTGLLSVNDNLAFATALVDHAHARGLAFGQKNGVELGARGRDIGFDFAIVESCQVYNECDAYTDVFGDHVLEIEYADTPLSNFETACAARGNRISVILRDRGLAMPGVASYVYAHC